MPDTPASAEETALARMAPIISHELRNPLAVIKNSAYFIKTKLGASAGADPKVEKHLGIIESEIRRADDTLGEILAFARMREPTLASQRLNAVVEEALKDLPMPPTARIETKLSPEDPRVKADTELLRAAIRHLLRNGAEALVGGGTALRVLTGVSLKKAFVEISDDGPGMAAEALERLFIPFTTTKPRGIGLGLAFVQKAAKRMGGSAALESAPGKGVRATITLPQA